MLKDQCVNQYRKASIENMFYYLIWSPLFKLFVYILFLSE